MVSARRPSSPGGPPRLRRVAVAVLAAVAGRRPPRAAQVAVPPAPLDEPDLRARLSVLAEVALAQRTPLAVALVASADASPPERLRAPLGTIARGDDQLAVLDDAVAVILLAGCAEVCGFALRVARTLTTDVGRPVVVGVAVLADEPYPAPAMLRRAREALIAAQDAADVEGGPAAVLADTHLRRIDDAMVA